MHIPEGQAERDTYTRDPREEYLNQLSRRTWRRVGSFLAIILFSAVFAYVILLGTYVLRDQPSQNIDLIEAVTTWYDFTDLRAELREELWRVALGLLALLALTSLTRAPTANSDIEDHAGHVVSQMVGYLSALALAIYAWLCMPLDPDEQAAVAAWYPALVLLIAAAIGALMGPSRVQRLRGILYIRGRLRRVEERKTVIEEQRKISKRLNLRGWLTEQWREATDGAGFPAEYGQKAPVQTVSTWRLLPWWQMLLPTLACAGWVFWAQTERGINLQVAAIFAAVVSAALLLSTSLTLVVHYGQHWEARIGPRRQRWVVYGVWSIYVLFWTALVLVTGWDSWLTLVGNLIWFLPALFSPRIIGATMKLDIAELEYRFLRLQENRALGRQETLEELEQISQLGLRR